MLRARRLYGWIKLSLVVGVLVSSRANAWNTTMLFDRAAGHPVPVVDGELVVKLESGVSPAAAAAVAERYQIQVSRQVDRNTYVVTLPPAAELAAAIRATGQAYNDHADRLRNAARVLRADAAVRFAEPNAIMSAQGETWEPNDRYYEDQWHFSELDMEHVWGKHGTGQPSVRVAVLDSGVKWAHRGWNFHRDMAAPWDFVDGDDVPDDFNGHGTHTAGMLNVRTNNYFGLAGMAPDISVMPLRVLDAAGVGSLDALISALDWAIDHDAGVINMSLSFSPGFFPGETLQEKIADAAAADIVLVASTGNDGVGMVSFPAAFNEVIAVGAMDKYGHPASYSNWGAGLDLLAYGGLPEDADGDGEPDAILSISFDPDDSDRSIGYWYAVGTSQAAPQVAALAALLRSTYDDLSAATIRSLILAGCVSPDEGGDETNCATGVAQSFDDDDGDESHKVKRTSCWNDHFGYGRISMTQPLDNPVTLGEGVEKTLNGFIADYAAIPAFYPEGFFGEIVDTPEGLLLLLEDETGLYAFIDSGCDSREFESEVEDDGTYESVCDIAQYFLADWTLEELVGVDGGLLSFIQNNGGLLGFLNNNGALLGTIANNGGLLGMITNNGGLLEMLAANGGMLGLIDANGTVLELIAGNGGLLGFIGGNGGLLGMLAGNGGLLGVMATNGGLLGYMGSNGSIVGLATVSGQSVNGVDRVKLTRRPF